MTAFRSAARTMFAFPDSSEFARAVDWQIDTHCEAFFPNLYDEKTYSSLLLV
jgi:hypothetical protein